MLCRAGALRYREKNIDSSQRSMLRGAPPKVNWVRIGNASTHTIAEVLRSRFASIQHFIAESNVTFVELAPHDYPSLELNTILFS